MVSVSQRCNQTLTPGHEECSARASMSSPAFVMAVLIVSSRAGRTTQAPLPWSASGLFTPEPHTLHDGPTLPSIRQPITKGERRGGDDNCGSSDPHFDRASADSAPPIPEVTREYGLPIGSRTPPGELKIFKRRLPSFHGESDGCWKESIGDKERKHKEDAAPEDADTALQMSGLKLGSSPAEIPCRNEDRWPRGAHE
ncbi:hypothetical protein NDU88_001565 [Pleurodeles waltl]|uniref:Uncharacterized protein n=1 Tax=Pleurodeles waltl TaxID=8319 RepID=A0AAV7Q4R3_PLEWA|nr:hypothetical protein NDU88_001565 [Pleurodeles waltl]